MVQGASSHASHNGLMLNTQLSVWKIHEATKMANNPISVENLVMGASQCGKITDD